MFKFNANSSRTTNNTITNSIRRSQDAVPIQQDPGSSIVPSAEQCLRDDRNLSLLYMDFDGTSPQSSPRRRNASLTSLDMIEDERDKTWNENMLDYKFIDAELSRIQLECEKIEASMILAGIDTSQDQVENLSGSSTHSNRDFNLVGSALRTSVRRLTPTRTASPRRITNLAPTESDDDIHISGLNEYASMLESIAASLPSLSELSDPLTDIEISPSTSAGYTAGAVESPTFTNRSASSEDDNMERLSTEVIDNNESSTEKLEPYKCPVCLKCVRQRKPTSTICGHVFCSSCIKTALRTTYKCPVCQKLMTSQQIFRIFI